MRWLCCVALVALAGCDSGSSESSGEAARPFEVEGGEKATRVDPARAGAAATFGLTSDGLIVMRGTGAAQQASILRFGDAQAATVAAMARDLGQPTVTDETRCDAGPLQVADFGEIEASFRDGKFVGWEAARDKGLNTGDGLAPGKPFRQMERIGARMAPETKRAGEFLFGDPRGPNGMGGFMGSDDKVDALYAGKACVIR